ncbi:MFS transporter [Streptomyces sp. MST-110588]|uniref:MFS transporter n=1 Tax=Streptomyces sp. MST-110588 TaxID=2833628 RepID=UPI001F5DF959|nr:MFS transporter [Streptomyces sp. MST-110588]UNO41413.1 MFS transporter [Streptomyces sp. MST-110588]
MGYRDLATRPLLTWAFVAVCTRLPVAMAPLALVFLVREGPGGYPWGAGLAAAYVVGEVIGAPLLGTLLRPERARVHLAAGLAVGAAAFAGLGLFPGAPPAAQAALAVVSGAGPAAVPGGLRTLLTELAEQAGKGLAVKALSAESVLSYLLWALAPALAGGLAVGGAGQAPILLAAALLTPALVGLWALPYGWQADSSDRGGVSMARTLVTAWPLYVSGAAALALLALAELVLPALLEQRGIAVGWSGVLLGGYSLASAVGSFLYGLRSWPGRLRTQGLVLLPAVGVCVSAVAVLPTVGGIAVALLTGGLLMAGVQVARGLSLRAALPPSALAAGYSVMYAAIGAGYASSATLSGAVLSVAAPSTTLLCGVALMLVLTAVAVVGELRSPAAGVATHSVVCAGFSESPGSSGSSGTVGSAGSGEVFGASEADGWRGSNLADDDHQATRPR